MRLGLLTILMLTGGCAQALAQSPASGTAAAYTAPKAKLLNEAAREAAAREAALFDRISERSRKATRSVCAGCDSVGSLRPQPDRNLHRPIPQPSLSAEARENDDVPVGDPGVAPSE